MEAKENLNKRSKERKGAVLIFLPGLHEIEEMKKHLERIPTSLQTLWIVPLHSSITSEEQDYVFTDAPEGRRKVILSTNIAESSITVPDVRYGWSLIQHYSLSLCLSGMSQLPVFIYVLNAGL